MISSLTVKNAMQFIVTVLLLVCTIAVVDGFMIASPARTAICGTASRQQSTTIVAMAKNKEEDLELTRKVIREYMEKADGETVVTTPEASSEPVAATASEEK